MTTFSLPSTSAYTGYTGPTCPKCGNPLTTSTTSSIAACQACRWRGRAYSFDPPPVQIDQPKQALADDATCVHHPNKQAVTVCEGTGSYICALCAVEVNGKTYSADFLNRGGLKKLGEFFDRNLPRPDRAIVYFFVFSIFPYTAIAGPVLLILAFIRFAQYRKMLTQESLLKRVVPRGRTIVLGLTLIAWLGLYLLVSVGILAAIYSN